MAYLMECAVCITAALCVAGVAIGMWSQVQGGGIPLHRAFGWHPVLMTLAYAGIMPLGRWAYLAGRGADARSADIDCREKARRRLVHRGLMIFAVSMGTLGYFAIIVAHSAKPYRRFGYNWDTGEFAEWRRVLHSVVGQGLATLVLVQAIIGGLKMQALKEGIVMHQVHGRVGKIIMLCGMGNMLLATWFWNWSSTLKAMLSMLLVILALLTFWQRPPNAELHEAVPLEPPEAEMWESTSTHSESHEVEMYPRRGSPRPDRMGIPVE
mmetsp:Transcript_124646/g.228745  ORF Transcript_124646/g.228745 Transcript_124646/m.228745 type:complete len:267 (+) Transcript_124646:1-801(+)